MLCHEGQMPSSGRPALDLVKPRDVPEVVFIRDLTNPARSFLSGKQRNKSLSSDDKRDLGITLGEADPSITYAKSIF